MNKKYTYDELLEWVLEHWEFVRSRRVAPTAAASLISYFLSNPPEAKDE